MDIDPFLVISAYDQGSDLFTISTNAGDHDPLFNNNIII